MKVIDCAMVSDSGLCQLLRKTHKNCVEALIWSIFELYQKARCGQLSWNQTPYAGDCWDFTTNDCIGILFQKGTGKGHYHVISFVSSSSSVVSSDSTSTLELPRIFIFCPRMPRPQNTPRNTIVYAFMYFLPKKSGIQISNSNSM